MPNNVHDDTETDVDSLSSFGGSPGKDLLQNKPTVRYAWNGIEKVDHESFQRMLEEYRAAKVLEKDMALKIKQLSAQLARTEEAAKRALLRSDPSAKGGAAQKLLDAERIMQKLREEKAELTSKLAREKKRTADYRAKFDETSRKLERVMREQRSLVERLGREKDIKKREPDFLSEESRHRFVRQQEELVTLREENVALKANLTEGHDEGVTEQLQAELYELKQQVLWYQARAGGQMQTQQQEGVWLLEEVRHDGQVSLLDTRTQKVFTFATDGQCPKPIGRFSDAKVSIGSKSRLELLLNTLNEHLERAQQRLSDVWAQFDKDKSGKLERHELTNFFKALLPDCSHRDATELQAVIDADGDGQVTMQELLDAAKVILQARQDLKSSRPSGSGDFQRIRSALRQNTAQLQTALQRTGAAELSLMQAVDAVAKVVPGMTAKERSLLLLKLHMWDLHGAYCIDHLDLMAALELRSPSIQKSTLGQQPVQPMSASVLQAAVHSATKPPGAPSNSRPETPTFSTGPRGAKLHEDEAYMRERVARLEADLRQAQKHAATAKAEVTNASKLRSELAAAQSRLADMEADMLAFNPSSFAALGDETDAALKQVRAQLLAYKKRYSEGHSELEALKSMHSRVVEQLEATHAALDSEQRARFASEDEAGRMKLEVQRLHALQEALTAERNNRIKLEREVVALQSRALAAPSSALEEVRSLREELFRAGREKATAEQRESELRRELNALRREVAGVSATEYQRLQDNLSTAQRRLVATELELQAAREKLEVYRRTELPQHVLMETPPMPQSTSQPGTPSGSQQQDLLLAHTPGSLGPDADKSAEELKRELVQLRAVYMAEKAELTKLRKILQHESEVVLEAKACEEAMRSEVEAVRTDMHQQLAALRRQLDSRDEQIHKLEAQLRNAYSGMGKVVRASRQSLSTLSVPESDDLFRDLAPGENLFEVSITDAILEEKEVGRDKSTFVTVDFFMHDTQSTNVATGVRPSYDTLLQYVLEADRFFLDHMATGFLNLELCEASGMDYTVLGSARLPLRLVLEDIRLGSATKTSKAIHHVEVLGAGGQTLGRIRMAFVFRLPLDKVLLNEFCQALVQQERADSTAVAADVATAAAKRALEKPSAAAHARVHVLRCSALQSQTGSMPAAYVHYRFPGFSEAHDTQVEHGVSPDFDDECTFALVRSKELDADFRNRSIELVVFDDNGGDSPMHSIIGITQVPLTGLATSAATQPLTLQLRHPITKQLAGCVDVSVGWCNPLIPAPLMSKGNAAGTAGARQGPSAHGLMSELSDMANAMPLHQGMPYQASPTPSYSSPTGPSYSAPSPSYSPPALTPGVLPVSGSSSNQLPYAPDSPTNTAAYDARGQPVGLPHTSKDANRSASISPARPTRFAMESSPRKDVLEMDRAAGAPPPAYGTVPLATTNRPPHSGGFGLDAEL